jgi:hypothetical protein
MQTALPSWLASRHTRNGRCDGRRDAACTAIGTAVHDLTPLLNEKMKKDITRQNARLKTAFKTTTGILLLELEIQRSPFNVAAIVVAHLQLHFIRQKAAVKLERARSGGVFLATEHLRKQRLALG